jgi:flagellar protein FliL
MASKDDSKDKDGKGGGMMPLIIAAVLSIVIGVGAGYGTIVTFAPPPTAETAAKPAEKPAADAHSAGAPAAKDEAAGGHGAEGDAAAEEHPPEPVDPNDVAYTVLPPVITNVAEPKNVWLRMEGGITYLKSGEKKPEVLAGETAQQIVQYLRTVRLADVEGQDGLQFLQDDLNDITRALSNGQVQTVLISGLIVE